MASDGAEIDPDRHGGSGDFYLINVGRVRIPYGQPEREAELRSVSSLGYTDEDLFIVDPRDPRRQVPMRDRHLDAQRAVEELRALADLAQGEPGSPDAKHAPTVRADLEPGSNSPAVARGGGSPAMALVDGTLLFS